MRVLVTPTSLSADRDHPALAPLRDLDAELVFNDAGRPLTSVEVAHALVGVDAVIAGLDDFDAAAKARTIAISATAAAFAPAVRVTATPRACAASSSTLSTPAP